MTQIENVKPPCPFCKNKDAEKIQLNGRYMVSKDQKNEDGSFGTAVNRYLCKNCGEGYTEHLRIEEAWNYGYVKKTKRRTIGLQNCEYDPKNEGESFRKLKSHHNAQKEKALFAKIDEAIISRGFFDVHEMKRLLGIGTTTYYRYLTGLRHKMFWSEDNSAIKNIQFQNGLLVELKTKLYVSAEESEGKVSRRETVRVFILFDKETHLAFDFFLVQKKKYRSIFQNHKPEDELSYFGHIYSTPQVVQYSKILKSRYSGFQIEFDCGHQTKKMLLKSAPEIFRKSRLTHATFWKDLEKFKLRRNLTFSWTLTGKKIKEKPSSLKTQAGDLETQIKTLLSIYNRHHLIKLKKKGLDLRQKNIKPKPSA